MKLSKQQQEIVDSTSKNIIVDAGSGSGKTRTLTEKVRKILNDGVDPKSIVVITFTNLAADELRRRISDIPKSDKCFIGTIHSYANKLLKKTGYEYDIFSEFHQTEFMKALIPKYARYCTMDDYCLFVKYRNRVQRGTMSESEMPYKFTDIKVYKEIRYLLGEESNYNYTETVKTLCELNHIITFDELLRLSTSYFEDSKTVLEYLFVDELQDIGWLEYDFLKGLNATHNFWIGDDFQSIYGFKGGDVKIFLSIMNNPEWKTYYLTENYRTPKLVMNYANIIVSNAKSIIKKDCICMSKVKGELKFNSKSQIESFITSLDKNKNWTFLTRTNKELYELESKFKKLKVPYYSLQQPIESEEKRNQIMSDNKIKLMTVHKSKGLEDDNIAIYGKFPIKPTKDEDEYKVFYVGITRTKNKCIIFV